MKFCKFKEMKDSIALEKFDDITFYIFLKFMLQILENMVFYSGNKIHMR
mgnify:CR=1 FL=1